MFVSFARESVLMIHELSCVHARYYCLELISHSLKQEVYDSLMLTA